MAAFSTIVHELDSVSARKRVGAVMISKGCGIGLDHVQERAGKCITDKTMHSEGRGVHERGGDAHTRACIQDESFSTKLTAGLRGREATDAKAGRAWGRRKANPGR